MTIRRARLRNFPLVGVAGLAATTLAVLGAAHPRWSDSMTTRSGDDLLLGASWCVAAACSTWLLIVSSTCAIAVGTGRARRAPRLARFAPRFVGRLVEAAILGSAVIGATLPAAAAPVASPGASAIYDEPVVRAAAAPQPAPKPAPPPAAPRSGPRTHVVRAGDNLWRIARDELVARGNARPDEATVARYWHAVVADNRATLRSRDPSLIYPGELVALPPPH